ncbi:MAG: CDP-alcohol phosphatidyltransferase family protein, partial [Myxococcales bacterium]|nr:CDP-alcohol phosphatidyltransferase family protein [Myxococcales bacterium]
MARRRRNREFRADNVPHRGIFLLPNLITSASLFAGFYSVIMSVQGHFERAAWAIIVAAICDALDGRVARMTHTTSKFGVQYDSLSDLSSFGIAPSVMVYLWALQYYGRWGWAAAFVYLVCGALRLARFNV